MTACYADFDSTDTDLQVNPCGELSENAFISKIEKAGFEFVWPRPANGTDNQMLPVPLRENEIDI